MLSFSFPEATLRTPKSNWKHKMITSSEKSNALALLLFYSVLPLFQFGLDCLWPRRSYWLWGAQKGQNGAVYSSWLLRAGPRHNDL